MRDRCYSATSGSATSGSPRMTGITGDAKSGPLRFCTVIRQELVRITTGDRIGKDGGDGGYIEGQSSPTSPHHLGFGGSTA